MLSCHKFFTNVCIKQLSNNTNSQMDNSPKIMYRTLDRVHRAFFRTLERERELYHKKDIVIRPTLRFFLVRVQKEAEGACDHVKLSDHILPNPYKTSRLLEPIVFLILNTLHFGGVSDFLRGEELEKHIDGILRRILKNNLDFKNLKFDKNDLYYRYDKALCKLAEVYGNQAILEDEACRIFISKMLHSFEIVNRKSFGGQYGIETDLVHWVKSIGSPNVTLGCEALINLTDIPAFIVMDVLFRTPMSVEEYSLQLELWFSHISELALYYFRNTSVLKTCLENLLFYGLHYRPSMIPQLVLTTLDYFQSNKHGFHFRFLDKDYLNKVIWDLIFNYLRSQTIPNPKVVSSIIKAQEIIVQELTRMEGTHEHIFSRLGTKGRMGIILGINCLSHHRAVKLFSAAEGIDIAPSNTTKEIASYYFTSFMLCTSTETLLHNFNMAASHCVYSATMWLGFIKRLRDFNLLNEKRAKKILGRLVENREKVLITNDILALLLRPINSLKSINEFLEILRGPRGSNKLLLAVYGKILPKYMKLLYNSSLDRDACSFNYRVPNDIYQRILKNAKKLGNEIPEEEHCTNTLDCARLIYRYGFSKKTSHIIGVMLCGEAHIQPQNLYSIYQRELEENNAQANEQCLLALIMASSMSVGTDPKECITWGNLYAPQIATNEFKSLVPGNPYSIKSTNNDHPSSIYPKDELWQAYINLLSKYGYTSELSSIIPWWENLDFIPSYSTLLALLVALPWQFAIRYIKHTEQVRSDSVKNGASRTQYEQLAYDQSTSLNDDYSIQHKDLFHKSMDWPWPTVKELESWANASARNK